MQALRIIDAGDRRAVDGLVERKRHRDPSVEKRVRAIVEDVRMRGDRALMKYARELDGLDGPVEITSRDITRAAGTVPRDVRAAISLAARNIRRVAERQVPTGWRTETTLGVSVEQRVTPLDRVGCYVPGGRHPLPSSLLMTVIPAVAAGVGEITVACPRPDPAVMCAAREAGADRLLRIGGAHAIAALAYGTGSIPRVDKIVGPGNVYVAAAKALVSQDCAIDFFAGPSEIVVISSNGNPDWIAADLIAQAEHDVDARPLLLTPSVRLAAAVASACAAQMPASGVARASLARNGGVILTADLADAIALCERIAPEHVVCDSEAVAKRIRRAGTIFVGRHSAQALGDYATGSNHVLPTAGAARSRGGLSAADFVRVTSIQRIDRRGLGSIGPSAVTLARCEGLSAHARSIETRLEALR